VDFLEVLVPAFLQSLQEAMQANRVAATDLVAKTKAKLNTAATAVEHRTRQMEDARRAFTTALERLSVGDGENLLASALKSQLNTVEADLRTAADELDKLTRARNYLAKCKYQTDKAAGGIDDLLVRWVHI
jgi:small-conductance mechanosensitive channel